MVHLGLKAHQCQICQKAFSKKLYVNIHISTMHKSVISNKLATNHLDCDARGEV